MGAAIAWFAAEGWFLAGYGLPFGPRAWVAAALREALVPVLAAQAWFGRHSIDWRGTDLVAGWLQRHGDRPFAEVVSAQPHVCAAGHAPKQASTPEYAAIANYGYHFDAVKFGKLPVISSTHELPSR